MKTTLLAHRIHHFTPWAKWRHPRDHFLPLFSLALVVLAGLIIYLLKLEAMYREDAGRSSTGPTAESQKAPPFRQDAPGIAFSHEPGAHITGERGGHPTLQF